jgi:hypothetical protein
LTAKLGEHKLFAFDIARISNRRVDKVAAHVKEGLMDAEETEKVKKLKIRDLQETVSRGLKGINQCRYKTDCAFAQQCPGTC